MAISIGTLSKCEITMSAEKVTHLGVDVGMVSHVARLPKDSRAVMTVKFLIETTGFFVLVVFKCVVVVYDWVSLLLSFPFIIPLFHSLILDLLGTRLKY